MPVEQISPEDDGCDGPRHRGREPFPYCKVTPGQSWQRKPAADIFSMSCAAVRNLRSLSSAACPSLVLAAVVTRDGSRRGFSGGTTLPHRV
jgi:hypothetical protein